MLYMIMFLAESNEKLGMLLEAPEAAPVKSLRGDKAKRKKQIKGMGLATGPGCASRGS
jgi:hypothetical protein